MDDIKSTALITSDILRTSEVNEEGRSTNNTKDDAFSDENTFCSSSSLQRVEFLAHGKQKNRATKEAVRVIHSVDSLAVYTASEV